jgi:hypothetical protein
MPGRTGESICHHVGTVFYSVEKYIDVLWMQPFSCQHREQHISKRNYEIAEVEEIHISGLELLRVAP